MSKQSFVILSTTEGRVYLTHTATVHVLLDYYWWYQPTLYSIVHSTCAALIIIDGINPPYAVLYTVHVLLDYYWWNQPTLYSIVHVLCWLLLMVSTHPIQYCTCAALIIIDGINPPYTVVYTVHVLRWLLLVVSTHPIQYCTQYMCCLIIIDGINPPYTVLYMCCVDYYWWYQPTLYSSVHSTCAALIIIDGINPPYTVLYTVHVLRWLVLMVSTHPIQYCTVQYMCCVDYYFW
jgi:hypothetical protein